MFVQDQLRHLSWINPYMLEMKNIMRLLEDRRTPAWLIGIDPVGEMNALGCVYAADTSSVYAPSVIATRLPPH